MLPEIYEARCSVTFLHASAEIDCPSHHRSEPRGKYGYSETSLKYFTSRRQAAPGSTLVVEKNFPLALRTLEKRRARLKRPFPLIDTYHLLVGVAVSDVRTSTSYVPSCFRLASFWQGKAGPENNIAALTAFGLLQPDIHLCTDPPRASPRYRYN